MIPKYSRERLLSLDATSTILPAPVDIQPKDLSGDELPTQAGASLFAVFRAGWSTSATFLETVDGREWTYGQMCDVTASLSCCLQSSGLRRGDRLVNLMDRSPWNLFLYLACLRAGIVHVPLNPDLTPSELSPILADLDATALVCGQRSLDGTRPLLAGAQTSVLTLETDGSGSLPTRADEGFSPNVAVAADDAAAIVFTSGTTGRPKGAVMPHRHLVQKARALSQALGWQSSDRLLHTMPLHHAHGLFMTTHCVLSVGASMLLSGRFEATQTVAQLRRCTVFSGVPTMYHRMADVPELRDASHGMRLFVSASAPLPANVQSRFEHASGHPLVQCWGMTETMTNTTTGLGGDRRPGTVGLPLPGVQVQVLDEQDRPLPHGQQGLLAIRSTSRFGGYWRRPPEQQARFVNGFLVTGDIGVVDADNHVAITGRMSEVIITGGNNVYPKEVELALELLDGVAQAAVFSVPHPDLGEAVAAAIVASGQSTSAQDMAADLKRQLATYKIPKAFFLVDALPISELGKVDRRTLARSFQAHFAPTSAPHQGVEP